MANILSETLWPKVKEVLMQDIPESQLSGPKNARKRQMMEAMLDQSRRALMENASVTATTAGNIATLNKVILPVIRRVMPTVIANELIGVQPMTGPVGQISTLRVRYGETAGSPNPVTAGSEALSPFDIAKFYSGNLNSAAPAAAPTSQLEGFAGKRMNIQIVKETVEAKTRRLSATWTFESAQDAQSQYGIDIESEISGALAQEITAEIDQEILFNLRQLPGAPTVIYDQNNLTGVATFVGDEHAALATLIDRQANLVAQRTRRGAANWVVVSSAAITVLQSARTSAFARTTEGTFEAPTNVKFAGTLNGTMRVYTDTYAADNEIVLLGYKGNDTDAAAFFCPYIPLMSTGVVMDPVLLQPVTGFMTRYGYVQLTNTASSLGNAADYVAAIGVQNLRFS
jgi:hypothetical protein